VTGALAGIRVVDFAEYIAGPYCAMLLGDMGADVIKVERPDGDAWRHTAPVAPYEGRGFLTVNRGKRSIALDLEQAEAKEIAQKLIDAADVMVISYRPGVAQHFGLDYETLSARNPRLIYCENTAFGSQGPYAGRPGFDILSQAATGMVLYENKVERGVPTFIATTAIADMATGLFLSLAAVSALLARTQSGRGQRIEASLFASGMAAQYRPLLSVEAIDAPVREGFLQELEKRRMDGLSYEDSAKLRAEYIPARGRNNYYRVYETCDGLIAVACLNNRQRRALRDALGVEDPSVDGLAYDWFSDDVRQAHRQTTEPFEAAMKARTSEECIALLDAAVVPCGPVHFPEELFGHPHVAANEMMLTFDHPVLGGLRMPANPLHMSGTPPQSNTPPPALGADGPAILRELGYDEAQVLQVLDDGIMVTRERLLERQREAE
jgi:formyl-CoA transferase